MENKKGMQVKIQTGIDIIEVSRIQEAIEKQGELFLKKVYTENEIADCSGTGKMMYQHYAARFAAKEAVFKAISTNLDSMPDDRFTRIEIRNLESGKPVVNIDKLHLQGIESMDLSLSHIRDYAVASFSILFNN